MTAAAFGHPGCLLVFSFISPPNEDSEAAQLLVQGREERKVRREEGGINDAREEKGGRYRWKVEGREGIEMIQGEREASEKRWRGGGGKEELQQSKRKGKGEMMKMSFAIKMVEK